RRFAARARALSEGIALTAAEMAQLDRFEAEGLAALDG
ncbi:oxidoreductase, partial [Salipiger pacificus]|nr:oxidoreductase [Salipiger mangrovisoli]MBE9641002.1 oxidoreductase [Salipiger mangrovisoli]